MVFKHNRKFFNCGTLSTVTPDPWHLAKQAQRPCPALSFHLLSPPNNDCTVSPLIVCSYHSALRIQGLSFKRLDKKKKKKQQEIGQLKMIPHVLKLRHYGGSPGSLAFFRRMPVAVVMSEGVYAGRHTRSVDPWPPLSLEWTGGGGHPVENSSSTPGGSL